MQTLHGWYLYWIRSYLSKVQLPNKWFLVYRWKPLRKTIRDILMCTDMRDTYYTRSHEPTTIMICHRCMLFIQCGFHVSRLLDDALVVAEHVRRLVHRHRYSETTQLKSQMYNCLQACFQCNELCRESTGLDHLQYQTIGARLRNTTYPVWHRHVILFAAWDASINAVIVNARPRGDGILCGSGSSVIQ